MANTKSKVSVKNKPKRPKKKKTSFKRKVLKYTFLSAVAWGATNYYLPDVGDALTEKFQDAAMQHMDFNPNTNPWVTEQDTEKESIYNSGRIRVFGEEAENDFFSSVNIADEWYASLGRYEMLMQDADNRRFMEKWFRSLNHLRGKSVEEQARGVDAIVDQTIAYVSDDTLYGRGDYFASPIETLWHEKGDCEDFAILKYFGLKYLGVDDSLMYVVAVGSGKTSNHQLDHATLVVDIHKKDWVWHLTHLVLPNSATYWLEQDQETDFQVLDNDLSRNGRLIEEDRSNYVPYYAMNERSFWKIPKQNKIW